MRQFRWRLVVGIVGMVSFLGSTRSEGGFLTETVSTAPGGTSTDFALALQVPRFDANLGQLTQVMIRFSDTETMQGTVYNNASRTESYLVTESSTFSLALGAQQLLSNSLSATENCTGMASHSMGSFGVHQESGTTGWLSLTTGATFNTFLGSGSVNLAFSSLTSTTVIGGGGNASTGIYTSAVGSLTVIYDYIPASPAVPEPTSLSMCLVAIVLVSASSVRFRRMRLESCRDVTEIT